MDGTELSVHLSKDRRQGDWMQTYSGRQFWPCDPKPEEIDIEDIAHALSMQCRYGGHCKSFYSVAQHSIMVSQVCMEQDALWGLLHDAAEAYLVDLPRPIKHFSDMGELYRYLEKRLMWAVCDRFGLPREEPKSIKRADNILLVTEMRDLMTPPPEKWREADIFTPLEDPIFPWDHKTAEFMFMRRFEELSQ
jgi:hypothetical protein